MPFSFNFGGFNGGFSGGGFNSASGDAGQEFTPPPKRSRKPRKAVGSPAARVAINLAVTVLFGLIYFYLELPAINLHAEEFYVFIFLLCAVYCISAVLTSGFQGEGAKGYFSFVKKQCKIPFLAFLALIAVIAVGALSSWVVLRASSYSKLLTIEEGDFTAEV